jgi:hypothetical protein
VRLHPVVRPPLHPRSCHLPAPPPVTSSHPDLLYLVVLSLPPRQPSPLTRGTTSIVGDNQPTGDAAASPARAAHPVFSSATTVGLLLFFRQLPTDSDCDSARKKEGTRWAGSAPSTCKSTVASDRLLVTKLC